MQGKILAAAVAVLSAAEIYLLYAAAGSLVKAVNTPLLYGASETFFTGMYIMAASFFAGALAVGAVIAVLAVKLKRRIKRGRNGVSPQRNNIK